jgi:hypothetical protein
LPADHVLEIAGSHVGTFERLFIVDVVAVGQRYDRFSVAQRHGVGLVIVGAPVRNILAARRNEVIERIPGLLQSGAEPTYGTLSARPRDGIERSADDLSLILRLHFIEADGIAPVMAHPFPAALLTLLDDLGMMHADIAVERDGGANAISVKHLHQPKHADAVAVVAHGPDWNIGNLARPETPRARFKGEEFDIGNDPQCHAGAAWPFEARAADDRGIWKRTVRTGFHGAMGSASD